MPSKQAEQKTNIRHTERTGGTPLVKFDMHCHAKEGSVDAKLSIFDYAGVLKQKGYQGMLITDHDSYRSWKAWETEKKEQNKMEAEDFYIIKGIEYDTIDAGHFIVIMPDGVNLPILEMRGLPLLLLIALVHRYGGILGPAHPYGASFTSANRAEKLPGYRYAMSQVDFIETFNAAESYGSNSLAKKLAESYGKPETGGSDSHRLSGAATGYTLIDCDSITCANDMIRAIKEHKTCETGGVSRWGSGVKNTLVTSKPVGLAFQCYNRGLALAHQRSRRREWKLVMD